jgi:hypothetical protein
VATINGPLSRCNWRPTIFFLLFGNLGDFNLSESLFFCNDEACEELNMTALLRRYSQEIAVALLAFIVINRTGFADGLPSLIRTIIETTTAIAIAIVVRLLAMWPQLQLLIRHYGEIQGVHRKTSFALFTPRLERELNKLRELITNGVLVDKNELEAFVQACFGSCNGAYQGVDSHKPTDFFELYPQYLISQQVRRRLPNFAQIFFDEEPPLSADIRFLLVEKSDLVIDYQENPHIFENFCQQHSRKNINLLQVSPSIANSFASSRNLPSTDVGIFGWRYAVFFKPIREANITKYTITLQMLDKTNSAQLLNYLRTLNHAAHRIRISSNDGLIFMARSHEDIQACDSTIQSKYPNI